MTQGKVKAALRLLSDKEKGTQLQLDIQICHENNSLPPLYVMSSSRNILNLQIQRLISQSSTLPIPHPVICDTPNGTTIHNAAVCTTGSAGPTGVDAKRWRHLCTSFQSASANLCARLASVARKLFTTYVDPQSITPLLASCLIALDKCAGVRQIGVSETPRQIIGKSIMTVIKANIVEAERALQLCTGQEASSEAAIHAMCFKSPGI